MTREVESTIGEADSNPEDTGGPRVDRDTSGRPQEEDTYATRLNLAGEVHREQTQNHIEMEVKQEAYREAKVRLMAQEKEKDRQISQRAT